MFTVNNPRGFPRRVFRTGKVPCNPSAGIRATACAWRRGTRSQENAKQFSKLRRAMVWLVPWRSEESTSTVQAAAEHTRAVQHDSQPPQQLR